MRAALYARYSSDQQRSASIADQLRVCREYAGRQSWYIAAEFEDAAISGASLMRPGFQALMRDALAGAFDVVIAESLDRFSRDQEDTAALFKRLTFAGVRIVTLGEGDIGHLHVGFKGTMNALYLTDLAEKTRRGLRGRVEAGKSGGGLCYGYRVVQAMEGQPRGDREIDPVEAAIVQRIFRAFADGLSPIAIAKQLNAERIPGPHGQPWGPTTIRGHARRGTGVLNNELYVGRIVWNRLRYVKDPETGRRRSRLNPKSAWITADVAELRIVDDELWQIVKGRQRSLTKVLNAGATFNRLTRPKYLFSGLTVCGSCGSSYVLASHNRLACTGHRVKGTCSNDVRIERGEVETRILRALKDDLLDPELFDDFCQAFTDELNRGRRAQRASIAAAKRDLANVEREIRGIIAAVKRGVVGKTMAAELAALEQRQADLHQLVNAAPPPTLHKGVAESYREKISALHDSLVLQDAGAIDRIRGLVDKITINEDRSIRVHGDFAAMLTMGAGAKAGDPDALYRTMQVVAGGGFEPPTFGL